MIRPYVGMLVEILVGPAFSPDMPPRVWPTADPDEAGLPACVREVLRWRQLGSPETMQLQGEMRWGPVNSRGTWANSEVDQAWTAMQLQKEARSALKKKEATAEDLENDATPGGDRDDVGSASVTAVDPEDQNSEVDQAIDLENESDGDASDHAPGPSRPLTRLELIRAIGNLSGGVPHQRVVDVLDALNTVAWTELSHGITLRIPMLITLKPKYQARRPPGTTKMMFGKRETLPAKKGHFMVKAKIAENLKKVDVYHDDS